MAFNISACSLSSPAQPKHALKAQLVFLCFEPLCSVARHGCTMYFSPAVLVLEPIHPLWFHFHLILFTFAQSWCSRSLLYFLQDFFVFMVLLICFILTCDCIWISTLLLYLSVSFAFVNLFSKDFLRRSLLILKNCNSRSKRYPFCFNSFLMQVLSSASTFPVPSDLYSLVPYSQHSLRISLSFVGELHARDLCVSETETNSNF